MKAVKKTAGMILPVMLCLVLGCDNKPKEVELAGRFAMKGNAPFARLVFVSSGGRVFQVQTKDVSALKNKQKGRYRIRALAGYTELVSVDGKIKRKIYYIKDVKIISEIK